MSPRTTIEDLFRRRTQPAGDGHLDWTGYRNKKATATLHWNGGTHGALRVAYRIRTGQNPAGYAHATCEHPGCVAPEHVADSAVTPRRGHHMGPISRQPNGSDDQIKALLREGLNDRQIGRRLRTSPKRVAAIRAELDLPVFQVKPQTFDERWDANTEPVDGGHIQWTGRLRAGSNPTVRHEGRYISPRRTVFERLHGRPAVGRVLPGCGYGPCVRPDHLEDQPMRDQLAKQYAAIFGEVAA